MLDILSEDSNLDDVKKSIRCLRGHHWFGNTKQVFHFRLFFHDLLLIPNKVDNKKEDI